MKLRVLENQKEKGKTKVTGVKLRDDNDEQ